MTTETRRRSQLRDVYALTSGARFLASLPGYLRRPIDVAQAREDHAKRIATREDRFLTLIGAVAFDRPESLLGRLFAHVGLERGDVHALAAREGLEGMLRALFHAGVYVTADEFKGRKPLVRGSFEAQVTPESLANPLAKFHVAAQSGGSRSAAPPFLIDLEYVRASARVFLLHLDADGLSGARKATWEMPGAGCRFRILKYALFGPPPDAWFTGLHPSDPTLDSIFRWSQRAMRAGGMIAGRRLPPPTVATRANPTPVLDWLAGVLEDGHTPHLQTQPTAMVSVALAAARRGVDLTGAYATCLGEPTTRARLETIQASGMKVFPRFGTIEAGPIGYACRSPAEADEVHLVRDLHALIQPGDTPTDSGLPPRAILLTSLHRAAPYSMVNFSLGDEAIIDENDCGCALSRLGWNPRLRHVRSFEKFTAAGITFDDVEIVRLLEEALPSRFGGGPADFQLVEDETDKGQPTLVLRVDPAVGDLDAGDVRTAFFEALGEGSAVATIMQHELEGAVRLEVERGRPHLTRAGKFTHLHIRTRERT